VSDFDDADIPPFPTWNWHEEWYGEPKGILNMAKQVKLTAGVGDNKVEVGTATVEYDPMTNLTQVAMTVTDPNWVKLLGGNRFIGVMEAQKKEDTNE
jgi:hypothetical protein